VVAVREAVLRLRASWAAVPLAVGLGAVMGLALFRLPLRDLLAAVLVLAAALAVFAWPSLTMGAALVWLCLQELIRRLLIPLAGWSSNDPLLLVVPAVVVLYCLLHGAFRRPWNGVTRMMVVMLGVLALESLSPAGSGLRANLVGALFVVIPLLWFFIGRSIHPRLVDRVLRTLPWAALPVLAYGLWQLYVGLPPWDQAWVHAVGYAALDLGTHVRPFATFASSAEYEIFLLCAAVVSFGLAFRSRGPRAVLYLALGMVNWIGAFLDGSRTGIVLTVGAVGILWAYRRPGQRAVRLGLTAAGVVAGYVLFIHGHHFHPPSLSAGASATDTVFAHQMQGLTHPLSKKDSTLSIHLNMMKSGFLSGFRHPLGLGVGAITLAGSRFGSGAANSEFDVTNMFVAGGLIGGFTYLVAWGSILLAALMPPQRPSLQRYLLPALLLAAFGQWLNGGYYLVSALIWLVIGSALGRGERGTSPAWAPNGRARGPGG
jgi:hypothetical protein